MLKFDPTTTSGQALASLFRYWCELRGENPEGEVDGGFILEALSQQFAALGLDIGGPATQVDSTTSQIFTVFGLRAQRLDGLMVATVLPGEHTHAAIGLGQEEDHHIRWADTFTAPSAAAAETLARQHIEHSGDPKGYDVALVVYPRRLLDGLRHALAAWFELHPDEARPQAVSFRATIGHGEDQAWNAWAPTFHYDEHPDRDDRPDIPVDQLPDVNFERTRVADALIKLAAFAQPQHGDTLRIGVPSA